MSNPSQIGASTDIAWWGTTQRTNRRTPNRRPMGTVVVDAGGLGQQTGRDWHHGGRISDAEGRPGPRLKRP
jgi:hypothetical protein